ncbi:Saccharopine dehydrogenase-domain-containing protein, partial [Dimargaris cristalligena]
VWGATGFTGKYIAEYLLREGPQNLKFAIAGRNKSKLIATQESLGESYPNALKLPLIIADSANDDLLQAMARQSRVVISTVGPFLQYGEPLVRACAQEGTDYVDITGEAIWVKLMAAKYHDLAVRNQALIVSCCGFDSIPSDLGVFMVVDYIKKRYGKDTGAVKGSMVQLKGGLSGGTLASAVESISNGDNHMKQLARISKDSKPKQPRPKNMPGAPSKYPVYFDNDFGKWQGFFFMAPTNTSVVRSSSHNRNYGPLFRYDESLSFKSAWSSTTTTLGLIFAYFMVKFSPTRWLLMKFLPAPGEGPSRADIEKGHFTHRVVGQAAPAPERAYAEVVGTSDPGYGETIKYVAESALCLAFNREQVAAEGGVLSPAAAMGEALLTRFRQKGMRFTVSNEPFLKAKI